MPTSATDVTAGKAKSLSPRSTTKTVYPSFVGLAWAMLGVATVAFVPPLAFTSGRRGPVSALAAIHGAVSFAWLLLFLLQSKLVAGGHLRMHKRLGIATCCVAALMLPLGYMSCISVVRRGFDLSGDLHAEHDPAYAVIFPLFDLLMFAVFVAAAIGYRHRPAMHKRLMLFASIVLMPAPLAHFIGHVPWLAALPGSIVMIPIAVFLAAAIAREYVTLRRVDPMTWSIALG